jgi:collagen type VII alpha
MKNVYRIIMLSVLTGLLFFLQLGLYAQQNVGIGTTTPNNSAILDLTATNKGLLIPRMTTAQRVAIVSPATGLLVYDTDFDQFWYFNGVVWVVAIGPMGPTGPSGVTGAQGPTGTNGAQGPTGLQGLQGITGPTGTAGAMGVTGPTGQAGIQGTTGPTGQAGVQGVTGPTGQAGIQGATGPSGTNGAQGATGPTGLAGIQGATGPSGQAGIQGATGPSGVAGVQGPTGPSGSNGAQGVTGPTGPSGSANAWTLTGNAGTVAGTNFIGTTDAIDWVIKTNNTERARVLSAGNLGIGTAAPVQLLDVNGNINMASTMNLRINNVRVLSNLGTSNLFVGDNAGIANLAAGQYNSFFGWEAGSFNTTGMYNTFLGFRAGNANVGGHENVIIGDRAGAWGTSSLVDFNVMVGAQAGLVSRADKNTFIGGQAGSASTTGSNNVFVGCLSGDANVTGGNNTLVGYNTDLTSTGLTNAAAIGYNAQVAASNAMILGGTGADAVNVGIGTTTPLTILQLAATNPAIMFTPSVSGGSGSYKSFKIQSIPGAGFGYLAISCVSDDNVNTYSGLTIDANGKIASGYPWLNPIPYDLSFYVNAGAQITKTIGATTQIGGAGYPGAHLSISAGAPGTGGDQTGGNLYLSSGSSRGNQGSQMEFKTTTPGASGITVMNPTTKMLITPVGYVGIGTTAPASILHTAGQIRTGIPLGGLGGAAATLGSFQLYNPINVNTVTIQSGTTTASYTLTLPTSQGAASTFLQNDGAGNLSWAAAGGGSSWQILGNAGTNAATNFIGTTDAIDMVVRTNSTEVMRLTSGGNVGIGTNAPITKFVVLGQAGSSAPAIVDATAIISRNAITASNNYLGLISGGGAVGAGNAGIYFGSQSFPTDGSIYYNNTTTGIGRYMVFQTAALERMRIDNAGFVGINTTAPGSSLDVKGTLRLSGSGSGYVGFAPAAAAGNTTYTLPNTDGLAGQQLTTSGAGVLSWANAGGSSLWTDAGNYIFPSTMSSGSFFIYDDMGGGNNQMGYMGESNNADNKQLLRVFNTSTSSVASGRNNAIFAETGVYTGSGGSWALARSSGAVLGYENSTTGGTYSYGVAGYHYGNTAITPHAAVVGGSNFTSTTNVPLTNGFLGYQFDATNAYGVYGLNTWTGINAYGGYFTATGAATTNYGVYGNASGAGTNYGVYCNGNGGYTGTWTLISDERFKENISPYDNALEKVMQVKTYNYTFKKDGDAALMNLSQGQQTGFISQQLEQVFPGLVREDIDVVQLKKDAGTSGEAGTKEIHYKGVNYTGMIPILTKAMQEQQGIIDDLKTQINDLKTQLEKVNEKIGIKE